MSKKNTSFEALVEDRESKVSVVDSKLYELSLGEYTSEFISELIHFAIAHDLESSQAPLAILNDAFNEVVDRLTHKS